MKTTNFYLSISIAGLMALLASSCRTGTPGDAVRTAMEKELIKEKAEVYIEENNVPAVVVEEFMKGRNDTVKRKWLVYKEPAEEQVNVKLPDVYIVAFRSNDQNYRAKYSREGDILTMNHMVGLSVLPDPALNVIQRDDYKGWQVVGDVYETLDNVTGEPTGFIVNVSKDDRKERVFFDLEGNTVKIQTIQR